MDIQNQILGLQGFQNKLGSQYFEYIVLLELNGTDSHYYLRLLSIDHKRVYHRDKPTTLDPFLKQRVLKNIGN